MAYTKEDILRIVKEEDIEFIRLQFTDIFGQLKNVAITASQVEKAMDNKIMFDGSSIEMLREDRAFSPTRLETNRPSTTL